MNFMPNSFLRLFDAAKGNHIEIAFRAHVQVYPQCARSRGRMTGSIDRLRCQCGTFAQAAGRH